MVSRGQRRIGSEHGHLVVNIEANLWQSTIKDAVARATHIILMLSTVKAKVTDLVLRFGTIASGACIKLVVVCQAEQAKIALLQAMATIVGYLLENLGAIKQLMIAAQPVQRAHQAPVDILHSISALVT